MPPAASNRQAVFFSSMIQVRVLCFGVLKDWLGASAATVELPESATVASLLAQLSERRPEALLSGIAVSVNAEFARLEQILHEGDEVGLLPPVSGGSDGMEQVVALCSEVIQPEKWIEAAKRGEDGAVVVFDGIVRNNTRGRETLYLDYEAYSEMAEKQMDGLASDARTRFSVRHVTMIHRIGRLNVGETSVLIVVASAHRAQAFEACRWLIDTLKKTVPIWKKETFADGTVWAAGEPFPAGMALDLPEDTHGL
jgi:molybdopterin synthase catalytic subunit